MSRHHVFGLPIDALTMDETVARCVEFVEAGEPVQHVVLNVIKIVLCHDDTRLRAIISSCPIINADGQYFTWAARVLGVPLPARVTGIDLMSRLLAAAAERAGLPSPRKETFVAEQLAAMGPVFAMGRGGSFDVWAGLTRRAPKWMQDAGLEWLFRLIQEPGRMWRRIVVNGWRFTWLFLRELVRRTLAPTEA